MRSVKDAGPEEVNRLRRRIARALGTRAISPEDHDYIRTRLDEVDERISTMNENASGEEMAQSATT
jgi:hypothetical protein